MELGLGTQTTIGVPATYRSPLVPTHTFKNASANYPSSMTLAQALATSPNTAFVRLEDQIGLSKVADMSVRLGMKGYLLDAGDVDPAFTGVGTNYEAQITQQKMASFTLGVSPVSPLELANVGATLKSDGQWCPPTPVESITDTSGKLLSWKQQSCEEAVAPDLAHTLTVAMEGDLKDADGTSHAAATAAGWDRIAAGKTGTTQDYKSSAYLGFTPQYSGAVITWDYLPRPQPICKDPLRTCTSDEAQGGAGMSGGSVPAATWLAAMKPLHEGLPNADFAPPSPQYLQGSPQAQVPSVVGLSVDVATDQLQAKGFQVKVVLSDATGAAANTVVDQDPKDNALPNTTVTLTVATGGSTGAEPLPGGTGSTPGAGENSPGTGGG
jgi:membrane peptidoglycan carboxypeptidase